MSATEIIAEIEKLPLPEQKQVLVFLQRACASASSPEEIKYANDAAFDQAAENVLRERSDLFRRLAQ